mgnify:CR=1 FL=1
MTAPRNCADRLVLAYLGRLARASRMARCTADSCVTRAIHDRDIDEEVALPAAIEADKHHVRLPVRARAVLRERVPASCAKPVGVADLDRVHTHAACDVRERAL